MNRTLPILFITLSPLAWALGCSAGSTDGNDGTDSLDGSGGTTGSGGSTSTGGTTPGSGGALGSGGGTATGGTNTGGAPSGVVGCTGSELLCEDFEDTAVDATPGAPWGTRDSSCAYQSGFGMGVSEANPHLGSKSLKVTNTSYAQCRISASFGEADDFWVRAFVHWDSASDFSSREILELDLHGAAGSNCDSTAIRFGNRSKAPCEATPGPQITLMDIAGGEQTGCSTSTQIPKGEWYCFEAHVSQASTVSVKTYINGDEFSYASTGKPETTTIDTPSAPSQKMTFLRLGLFSTTSTMGEVFIDDVAVATTRLGCGTP